MPAGAYPKRSAGHANTPFSHRATPLASRAGPDVGPASRSTGRTSSRWTSSPSRTSPSSSSSSLLLLLPKRTRKSVAASSTSCPSVGSNRRRPSRGSRATPTPTSRPPGSDIRSAAPLPGALPAGPAGLLGVDPRGGGTRSTRAGLIQKASAIQFIPSGDLGGSGGSGGSGGR